MIDTKDRLRMSSGSGNIADDINGDDTGVGDCTHMRTT